MKKILIIIAAFGVLWILYNGLNYFYFTRLASPAEHIEYNEGDFSIEIDFCRPSKKNRLVFGTTQDGALVPYGEYWRLGANQATEIEFNQPVKINGRTLGAGRYRLYAIPGQKAWELVFNSELGVWGFSPADQELDILKISVPVNQLIDAVEMFSISISQKDGSPININFFWDNTLVSLPISYE